MCEVEVMEEVEWMDVVFPQYPDLLSAVHLEASSKYYFIHHYQTLPTKHCT